MAKVELILANGSGLAIEPEVFRKLLKFAEWGMKETKEQEGRLPTLERKADGLLQIIRNTDPTMY